MAIQYINGIPLYWDEEADKKRFGGLFPNGLTVPQYTNESYLKQFQKEKLKEIQKEIVQNSPFGNDSIFNNNATTTHFFSFLMSIFKQRFHI